MGRFDTDDKRLRGRAGMRQRERRLTLEPLCRHCAQRGVVTPAEEVDHIKPLAFGGTDTDDNVQCLCMECHAIKTAEESAAHQGASNHPEWLEPSNIPLTILCGPPCSGKTTYIKDRAHPADIVIDIDQIAAKIEPRYRHWEGMLTSTLLDKCVRVRNAILGSLSRARRSKAWFIVAAPTKAERDWWQSKLGGEIVLLDPGIEECNRRAIQRGTPKAIQGVTEWHAKAARPWAPKKRKPTIGLDGWPVE
jgi:hypothetical protein